MYQEDDEVVQAWVLGTHLLPQEAPRHLRYDLNYRHGSVVVNDGELWHIIPGHVFDSEYEWL